MHVYFQRTLHQDHYHHVMSSMEFGWDSIFQLDDSFPKQTLENLSRRDVERRLKHFEEKHSCVRFTPQMTAQVWVAWGAQLHKEQRFDEGKRLFRWLVDELADSAKILLLADWLGPQFKELPEDFKDLVAQHYWSIYRGFRKTDPRWSVHFRNPDIVDHLKLMETGN